MKNRCLPLFILSSALLFCFSQPVAAAPTLSVDDCVKCHEVESQQIADAGAAHKKQVDCLDCHSGHRPASANNIPACGQCHEGSDHYALAECNNCHNPHQPLQISLSGELKAECLTCHSEQNAQMDANPSRHSEFSCNFCHAEKHGEIPACTTCHDPHSTEMTQTDCATCHAAHAPTVLAYPESTRSSLCAACHSEAYDLLMATKTKHHSLSCVECHQDKHQTTPLCSDCHGTPHAPGIHAKFPLCGNCHNTAHDLDNLK